MSSSAGGALFAVGSLGLLAAGVAQRALPPLPRFRRHRAWRRARLTKRRPMPYSMYDA